MSNHTWDCEHGVEMGQGCANSCPECDAKHAAKAIRRYQLGTAFTRWIDDGSEESWRIGVRTMAGAKNYRLDVREEHDPARPSCAVCN